MRRIRARCFQGGPAPAALVLAPVLLALACGVFAMWPSAASAEGALAVGLPGDVSSQGFAFGISANLSNSDDASRSALDLCRSAKGASNSAKAVCKVVGTLNNQCAVVAMDPQKGTPGVGWGVAYNTDDAKSQAMKRCYETAGASRQTYCVVSGSVCDTGTAPSTRQE